jgi:hypothetical protein
MSEREKPPEVEGREKSTRQPNLLDVVKGLKMIRESQLI